MTPAELSRRLAVTEKIAREAGTLARTWFDNRDRLLIETKGPQDLVSEADRAVEALIRERLAAAFPGERVIGEEGGDDGAESAWTDAAGPIWIVDPIDGTQCFLAPGAFATVTVIVDSPRLPFLEFEIERARVTLNYGNSKFEVRGRFVLDATSNGIDVLNEEVTVRFGTLEPFIIPAGSFLRKDDDDDEEFEYEGPSGGITKMKIETEKDRKRKKGRRLRGKTRRKIREKKDGKIEFKVEARGLDLGDIDLNNPVLFSLQIGFDYSQRRISFDDRGRFRRDNDDHQIKKFNDRDRGRRGKRDHRIKKHGHERHDD